MKGILSATTEQVSPGLMMATCTSTEWQWQGQLATQNSKIPRPCLWSGTMPFGDDERSDKGMPRTRSLYPEPF